MIRHVEIEQKELIGKIKTGIITFAGWLPGKIYGKLDCASGKRMKKTSRVFFTTEQEALSLGYRPCGNCMRKAYLIWKTNARVV